MLRSILFATSLLCAANSAQAERVTKNVTYAPSGQKLDVCQPEGERRDTGLILIHGGGFSSGNRNAMLGYCRLLAKGGFPSVTISYRLTSQGHAFPKALEDVSAAVVWMRANAENLGIDPQKIVLIGYSAGGTLAMSTGYADGSRIAGVVSVAGISDFGPLRSSTPHAKLRRDIDAYVGRAGPVAPSPIKSVSRGDPPTFLFHGKDDNLVPVSQSVAMAETLKARGVKVLFRAFEDAGHEIMLPNKHLRQLLQEMTGFLVAIDER